MWVRYLKKKKSKQKTNKEKAKNFQVARIASAGIDCLETEEQIGKISFWIA